MVIDYRPIALVTALSKVFESTIVILLNLCHQQVIYNQDVLQKRIMAQCETNYSPKQTTT